MCEGGGGAFIFYLICFGGGSVFVKGAGVFLFLTGFVSGRGSLNFLLDSFLGIRFVTMPCHHRKVAVVLYLHIANSDCVIFSL